MSNAGGGGRGGGKGGRRGGRGEDESGDTHGGWRIVSGVMNGAAAQKIGH